MWGGCGILVRQRGDGERFEIDPYAPHVMEQMLRTYIDEFRAREAWVRPLLGGSPTVLEIGANLLGFPHLYGFSAASLDRLAAAHGFTPAAHISGRHIPRRATASPRPHASKSNA
jgi:hypothetical protein